MTDFCPEGYVPTASIVDSFLATVDRHAIAFNRKEPRPRQHTYRGKALGRYPCGRPEVWVHARCVCGATAE